MSVMHFHSLNFSLYYLNYISCHNFKDIRHAIVNVCTLMDNIICVIVLLCY